MMNQPSTHSSEPETPYPTAPEMLSPVSILVGSFSIDDVDHGGTGVSGVVTDLPPTSEVCGSNPRPYVGKLVVAY